MRGGGGEKRSVRRVCVRAARAVEARAAAAAVTRERVAGGEGTGWEQGVAMAAAVMAVAVMVALSGRTREGALCGGCLHARDGLDDGGLAVRHVSDGA